MISGESLIDSRIASKFRDIRSLDLVTYRVEDYQGYELFDPVKRKKPKPKILQQAGLDPEQTKKVFAAAGVKGFGGQATATDMESIKQSVGKIPQEEKQKIVQMLQTIQQILNLA